MPLTGSVAYLIEARCGGDITCGSVRGLGLAFCDSLTVLLLTRRKGTSRLMRLYTNISASSSLALLVLARFPKSMTFFGP